MQMDSWINAPKREPRWAGEIAQQRGKVGSHCFLQDRNIKKNDEQRTNDGADTKFRHGARGVLDELEERGAPDGDEGDGRGVGSHDGREKSSGAILSSPF